MVAFELSGLLLLVAIVGVMAVARTRQPSSDQPKGASDPTDADPALTAGKGKQAEREAT